MLVALFGSHCPYVALFAFAHILILNGRHRRTKVFVVIILYDCLGSLCDSSPALIYGAVCTEYFRIGARIGHEIRLRRLNGLYRLNRLYGINYLYGLYGLYGLSILLPYGFLNDRLLNGLGMAQNACAQILYCLLLADGSINPFGSVAVEAGIHQSSVIFFDLSVM